MVGNSKVIYLQKKDGASIKAYVVDLLYERITGKTYVIVANQNGQNAKAYEIVDGEAVILSADKIGMFRGYKMNPDFERITSRYEDGSSYMLVKEASKEETPKEAAKKEEPAVEPKTEEVPEPPVEEEHPEEEKEPKDEEIKSDGSTSLPEEEEEKPELDSSEIGGEPEEDKEEPKLDEPKAEDAETASKPEEHPEPPVVEEHPEEKPMQEVVFYMYDQNVVKKYKAVIVEKTEDAVKVRNVKAIEVITGAAGLDVTEFLKGEAVEIGSYFVDYDNYNPTIENENGTLIATATLNHVVCKTEDMIQTAKEEPKEPEKTEEPLVEQDQKRILVFNGDIDVYEGKNHYTIWGCFCTVVSENPLTIVPDKNGVKTIIYEDEKANSISEVCQTYQNLYPNFKVYLTGTEIKGKDAITLEDCKGFTPQADNKQKTLLENGRKVLTEAEMIEKRRQELEEFKKKS